MVWRLYGGVFCPFYRHKTGSIRAWNAFAVLFGFLCASTSSLYFRPTFALWSYGGQACSFIDMRIDILTLFPKMFEGPFTESILRRAQEEKVIDIRIHDLRKFSIGKYKQVDDKPYGGGAGMVMMAEPIVQLIDEITVTPVETPYHGVSSSVVHKPHRIYLSPRGERLTQPKVEQISANHEWLLLLCGHYEGVDQRVIDGWIDEEISIGDYVLTGGELPAMVLVDAVARHIPGVLGKDESAAEESFSVKLDRKKEYPLYTRPEVFRDMKVPDVLLSGHHKEIEKWKKAQLR
ncbi:MAG: tRNA (guanine-N1)-methyltransferase [Candidatus Peribacteria bacterium]|nr:tRNA (guanine-N1)-methyltransferase [Candidatus Peribacteria bacterium]